MRHRRKTKRIGRSPAHRDAAIAAIVCGLVKSGRVSTTLVKAKMAKVLADKMVTRAKKGTLASRRQALSSLRRREIVADLFDRVAPGFADRNGGYTRVLRVGERRGDGAQTAILEWVNAPAPVQRKKKDKSSGAGVK